jgi:hypothetical protein
MKTIHGYGSSGKGGSTKELVRNWAFTHRGRFRSVVEGEAYDLYNPEVQNMRLEIGTFSDPDLAQGNQGITVIWVK